jgi:thymidylate synthase
MLKDGQVYTFRNINKFAQEQGLAQRNLSSVLNAKPGKNSIKGFTLVSKTVLPDDRYIDQLQELINGLKTDPFSRRHVVTMWNPAENVETVLAPCHYAFQCFVEDGNLDMIVVMRSLDLFLGLPFDCASYAILQTMLAKEVGLSARKLTFQGADTHIYMNHIEQVKEMLSRTPRKLPKLIMADKSMFDLNVEDITLEGYDPHPTISAPMAV